MMNEPNFGSSEYSEGAEELFALYVTRREAGETIDFEQYCEAHEDCSDELYGLHADWDNVARLLRRVENKRRGAAPEPEPVAAPDPPAELEPAPEPELVAPAPRRRDSPRWKLLSSFGLFLALAAGGLALTLSRDNGVLAREKVALTEEKAALAEESAERERRRLGLVGELETAREELAAERQKLADERVEKEQAQLAARRATTHADELSTRLQIEVLTREALAFRPARPENSAALGSWLARADQLGSRIEAQRAALEAAGEQPAGETRDRETAHLVALLEALDAFTGPAGPREQVAQRLALLERVRDEITEEDELAWMEAIQAIADREQSPSYAGLELTRHFALVPLGPDPESGLWLFADRRTGKIPARDDQGELQPPDELALLFQLRPGSTKEDEPVAPFFIATSELTAAHWEYAGVPREYAELGYSRPTPAESRLAGTDDRPVLKVPATE